MKDMEDFTFRTPHVTYLGKKLNRCPTCGSDVHLEEKEEGYQYWVCDGCYESYFYRLVPLRTPTPTPAPAPKLLDLPFTLPSKSSKLEHQTRTHDSVCSGTSVESLMGESLTIPKRPTLDERLDSLEWCIIEHYSMLPSRIAKLEDQIKRLQETTTIHQRGHRWDSQVKTTFENRFANHLAQHERQEDRIAQDRLALWDGIWTLRDRIKVLESQESTADDTIKVDLIDLRKKVGYLSEDLRKKNDLSSYREPTVRDCAECRGFSTTKCGTCKIWRG